MCGDAYYFQKTLQWTFTLLSCQQLNGQLVGHISPCPLLFYNSETGSLEILWQMVVKLKLVKILNSSDDYLPP